MRFEQLVSFLFPEQAAVSPRERFVSACAAFLALALVIWASQQMAQSEHRPFVIASMGSSAVLLFAVPHGPLSQPWTLLGGHLLSAMIGVLCAQHIPDGMVAAATALGLALFAMLWLRCMHPPAGATAAFAVIGGQPIQDLGWQYVFFVVGPNVVVLLAAALVINNRLPGRRYPARRLGGQPRPGRADAAGRAPAHGDILAAVKSLDTFIDVSEDDLERIHTLATIHRRKRELGSILCRDIMTREVVTVAPGSSLAKIWDA